MTRPTRTNDLHRAGSHAKGRHCTDPRLEPRLVVKAVGNCTLRAQPHVGVVVWTLTSAETYPESPRSDADRKPDPTYQQDTMAGVRW